MIEPDLLYTVLCDEVRREDNGKLMLLGLFDQVVVGNFPIEHRTFCIVNKWLGGVGTCTQQIRFVDTDDRILLQDQPLAFECGLDTAFTAIGLFAGLVLERASKIWVEIYLNDELKLRYPLVILQAASPNA